MCKSTIKWVCLSFAIATLSGCIQYTLVPAGEVNLGGISTTTGILWNKSPNRAGPHTTIWTADGESLNQVVFVEGLSNGESIFKDPNKDLPMPKYTNGMLLYELEELVVTSLTNLNGGQIKVNTDNMQPAKFGEENAIQFDISYFSVDGLLMSGKAKAAIKNGKLYMIMFTAADMHYFGKYEQEINNMFTSARLKQ